MVHTCRPHVDNQTLLEGLVASLICNKYLMGKKGRVNFSIIKIEYVRNYISDL